MQELGLEPEKPLPGETTKQKSARGSRLWGGFSSRSLTHFGVGALRHHPAPLRPMTRRNWRRGLPRPGRRRPQHPQQPVPPGSPPYPDAGDDLLGVYPVVPKALLACGLLGGGLVFESQDETGNSGVVGAGVEGSVFVVLGLGLAEPT